MPGSPSPSEEEFEDETGEELTFEQRKYGVYLDDEVRIVLDKRVVEGVPVVEGRYLSIHDDMVAIATKDDKTQWIAIDYIVSITCLFHRKAIPVEKVAEKREEHMFR